jgi:hypothetical protein
VHGKRDTSAGFNSIKYPDEMSWQTRDQKDAVSPLLDVLIRAAFTSEKARDGDACSEAPQCSPCLTTSRF